MNVEQLRGESHWSMPDDIRGKCDKDVAAYEACSCVQHALRRQLPDSSSHSVQAYLGSVMGHLLEFEKGCPAMRAWAALKLHRAANLVLCNALTLWVVECHQGPDAQVVGVQKMRRVDPHVRGYVLHGAIEDGRASRPGAVAQAAGGSRSKHLGRWQSQEMECYRATSRLSFWRSQVLSVACDSARVGRPGKDLSRGFVTD